MDRDRFRLNKAQPTRVPGYGASIRPPLAINPVIRNKIPVTPVQPVAQDKPIENIWYGDSDGGSADQSEVLFDISRESKLDRIKAWRAQRTVKKAAQILGEPVAAAPKAMSHNQALEKQLASIDPRSPNYRRPGALATPKAEPQTVNIQIQIPTLSFERLKAAKSITASSARKLGRGRHTATAKLASILKRTRRRALVGSMAVVILVAAGFVGLQLQHSAQTKTAKLAAKQVTDKASTAAVNAQPTFTPIQSSQATPAAGTATQKQTSYDGTKNTYSFTDTVSGKSILVSQQPVPAKFKSATEAVATVAQSLGAKESTTTSNGTAYIATDEKSNSQTVVFTKNELLLFIQSPFKHSATEWSSYINSLKS